MDSLQNITWIWILFFQTFFIMWFLNVCIGPTHNNDTEKNAADNLKNFYGIVLGMLNPKILHKSLF